MYRLRTREMAFFLGDPMLEVKAFVFYAGGSRFIVTPLLGTYTAALGATIILSELSLS